MGSGTLDAAGSSARLMGERGGTATDTVAVLVPGLVVDWRDQPRAVTASATAIPKNRLTGIDARYMLAMTYAKKTLTLPTVLSRFVRTSNLVGPADGTGVTHRWRCYICPRSP